MTKSVFVTTALFLSVASTSVMAHHPAADRVDPEIYAMIDENVSDTPHAEMTFDDMGGAMESAASAMEARADVETSTDVEERGQMAARDDVTEASSEVADERATAAEDQRVEVDTFDTLENVANLLEQ